MIRIVAFSGVVIAVCLAFFYLSGPSAIAFPTRPAGGGVTSSRTITAGSGLTGGGDLSADRTLAVGAGTGITVNADDVAVDTTVVWTTTNSVSGSNKTLASPTLSGTVAGTYTIGGVPTLGVDMTGSSGADITLTGANFAAQHFKANGTSPTTTAQAGLGTTGTCTVLGGGDTAFHVQLVPGGASIAAGPQCLFTFNRTWAAKPFCSVKGTNPSGLATNGSWEWTMDYDNASSTTGAVMLHSAAALTSGTTYKAIVECWEP